MKAGRAGSTPDVIASSPGASQPLRYFLVDVGEAVANLNTAVVGLDAVESGYCKPDSLKISWNPSNRSASARKARRFVLEAVLVRVSEALCQYIGSIAQLPRFKGIVNQWSRAGKTNEKITNAKRLSDISKEILGKDCFLTVGACLLIHWRNRSVHRGSGAKLTGVQIKTLKNSSDRIRDEFASLSVDRLLRDFDRGRPTLKEVTSLIAMAIRLVRKLDGQINGVSKEELLILLDHYGLDKKIKQLGLETSPGKRVASIVRLLQVEAPGLAEPYQKFIGN